MIGSIRHPRDRQRFRIERARDQSKDTNDAAIQAIEYALYRCLARSGDAEEWFAVESICPHSGGPLYQGDIEDGPVIICPYHEYRFDLRTGRCIDVSCEGDDNGEEQLMINRLSVVRYEDDRLDLSLQDGWRLVLDNDELDTQQIVEQFAADIIKLNVFDSVRSPSTLMEMAWRILQTADPAEKVRQTLQAAHAWQERSIKRGKLRGDHGLHVWLKSMEPPPRTADIKVVPANKAIRLGNAGSLQSRIAILHSLANIEQWAIDLAWDIIVRFASQPTEISSEDNGKLFLLPDEFLEDFVQVAADEAKHYSLLAERLTELGSRFGDLPIHGGLWESAQQTSGDLLSRLAIVHMVHEARGLDVNPATIRKFHKQGDLKTAEILQVIHDDEVTHVARGEKWFTRLCRDYGIARVPRFHSLVKQHFRGPLKPPFNAEDRRRAGLDEELYMPLSVGS